MSASVGESGLCRRLVERGLVGGLVEVVVEGRLECFFLDLRFFFEGGTGVEVRVVEETDEARTLGVAGLGCGVVLGLVAWSGSRSSSSRGLGVKM